ncbi:V-set domain-containing T-cell activation inhibitor 1-like [Micropterus salmoides]|uniref:V-set domain-containing T-cell activation inhibitor 1-like n=1 Tax=Micropterus salmoides TaxID=27706 RepID=UPI0018EC23A5|nr:V-set domain-containing T-cell activation inhibitor 1-like [Micropterus salmoides]
MATFGQIIFCSMITLIVLFSAIIILILALALSGSTSEVISTNTWPIGNLGEDQLLSCYVNTDSQAKLTKVSVTWEKKDLSGLVYKYQNAAPVLGDQNSQFKGRTQLFPDALVTGNASLLLRAVRSTDAGVYTCAISSSTAGGKVNINLRTAAFSAPTFNVLDGNLVPTASRWFPKPHVTWLKYDNKVLNGITNFTEDTAGMFSVVSKLQPVNISDTYTCRIENNLVTAVSEATVTGVSGVSENTYFTYSAASSLLASTYLSIMTTVLCIYYLT